MSEPRPAMRPLKKFLEFTEAKAIALEAVAPIERTETLPLEEAAGRVLAETVTAPQDVPSFPQATMDGYALIAEETSGAEADNPAVLTYQETIYAGHVPKLPVSPGSCSQIAWGHFARRELPGHHGASTGGSTGNLASTAGHETEPRLLLRAVLPASLLFEPPPSSPPLRKHKE